MDCKQVVVTGGAGFIGSWLCERLLAGGHQVTAVDSLMTGRLQNLAAVQNHPRLRFVQADVRDGEAIRTLLRGADWVIHLAALADIVPSIQKPELYYECNVTGTFQVMNAARLAGVRRVVYIASSSCYGIPNVYPTPESAPIQPEYPYALTKHLGEEIALHLGKVYQLSVVSLRLFNVYGPRSRSAGAYGAVFGVFLAQLLHGQPLTVVGDGTQTRDFTYVSDVISAVMAAAESDVSGEVLNVGSGSHYSINRLVELIGARQTVHIPKRPGEPDCTFADTTRIRERLGWCPQVSFEDGVASMLAHLSDWKDAPVWTPERIALATKDWFDCLKPAMKAA